MARSKDVWTYDGEVRGLEHLRELERDMGEHVVVLRPLRVRRVHVEARACPTPSSGPPITTREEHAPTPKSQLSASPSMPAPRGDVSGKRIAMPSFAAGPRKLPFCALCAVRA